MWNTGCRRIVNALPDAINVLDGENQGLTVTVPTMGWADFHSVIIPWCNRTDEVTSKAFRISDLRFGTQTPIIYIFQDFHTDEVCWSLASDPDPWASRMVINDGQTSTNTQIPRSAVDLYIQADRVWGVPATVDNNVFSTVVQTVTMVATAVGAIADAVKAVAAVAAAAAALTSDAQAGDTTPRTDDTGNDGAHEWTLFHPTATVFRPIRLPRRPAGTYQLRTEQD